MANHKGSTNIRSFPSRMFFTCVHLTQLRANWCGVRVRVRVKVRVRVRVRVRVGAGVRVMV